MFGVTESSRVVGGTCSVDGEMENTDVIFAEKRERRNLKKLGDLHVGRTVRS